MTERTASPSGERIGRYTLRERIAIGGMAEVFLADLERPGGFKKTVVVKRILPQFAADKRFIEMFLREGRLVARLNHPNVVQVFDLGCENDAYFLAMEHVEGLTLSHLARRTWAARQPLPFDVVAVAIADAALGLAHAHELKGDRGEPLGLVHRDVSPDNLIISVDGVTKVVDFGIARPRSTDVLTDAGELKGKLPFMAPEYLAGGAFDFRVDLYALGVTLYHLSTGTRPFKVIAPLDGTLPAIDREAPPPRSINPDVPAALEDLILRCLEIEPRRRPDSARAIADTLLALARVERQRFGAFVRFAMTLPVPGKGAGGVAAGCRAMSSVVDDNTIDAGLPVNAALVDATTDSTFTVEVKDARGAAPRRSLSRAAVAASLAAALGVGVSLVIAGGPDDEARAVAPVKALDELPDASPALNDALADGAHPADGGASAAPTALDAGARVIAVTAPEGVRWLLPSGALLGEGTSTLAVGEDVRVLVAWDVARDARTFVSLKGDPPVDYDALPRGVLDVRAPASTEVLAGTTKLSPGVGVAIAGTHRLRCVTAGVEERHTVVVQADQTARVDCVGATSASASAASAPAPPVAVPSPATNQSLRRAAAQRVDDGADWLASAGALELTSAALTWTPSSGAMGARPLRIALKDLKSVDGVNDKLTVTTSWGARFRFTLASASGWARDIDERRAR